jgi:hypothetical protein
MATGFPARVRASRDVLDVPLLHVHPGHHDRIRPAEVLGGGGTPVLVHESDRP